MPSNILNADTSFPNLAGEKSNKEKFEQISSYLFMLLEQLRYTLANIGKENFNETEFEDIAKIIRDPVYVQIEDTDRRLASLAFTAEGLTSRVEDAEGNISLLSQMVNGLSLSVTNGSSSSTISLVSNGVSISSEKISFSGMVTYSDLSGSGRTTINGDNITTGTISAITIDACTISATLSSKATTSDGQIKMCYPDAGTVVGGIRLDALGAGTEFENQYRMYVYTTGIFSLKLKSKASMSLESDAAVYIDGGKSATIKAPKIYLSGDLYINGNLYTPPTTTE
jgi:hypothetical protein